MKQLLKSAAYRPSNKSLHYLLALHQHQNFHKAADACFVSQSTLSTAIQNLEEQLKCQILERDHKRFSFTATGEEIVERAADILARVDDLMAFSLAQGDPECGKVRVGCIPTIAPFLLPRLMSQLELKYPKLEIYLREDTTENLLSQIHQSQLDVLILALPVDTGDLQVMNVAQDPFSIVFHPDIEDQFPLSAMGDEMPDNSIFLLEKEHCLSSHAVSACKLQSRKTVHPFSATSLHTLVQMLNRKMGATYLPKMAIDAGLLSGTELVSRDIPDDAYREIGLVWRPTSARLKTYRLIADAIGVAMKL